MSVPMGGGINLNVSAGGVFDWAVGDKIISASIVTDGAGTVAPELENPLTITSFEEMGFDITGTNASLYPVGDDLYPLVIGNTTHPQLGEVGAFATYGVDGTSVTVEVLRNPTVVYSDDADAYPDSGQVGDYYYIKMSPVRGLESRVKTNVPENAKFTDTIATKTSVGLDNVDNVKQMPISGGVLENYREKLQATAGTINLSLANVFTDTPSANRTYSISNAVSGQAHSFTLIITMGATVQTLTFPASVNGKVGRNT